MNESRVKTRIPYDIAFIVMFLTTGAVLLFFDGGTLWGRVLPLLVMPVLLWHLLTFRLKTFELTETHLIIATPFVPFLTQRIALKQISSISFKVIPPTYGYKGNQITIYQGAGGKVLRYDFRASEKMTIRFIDGLKALGVRYS